jgi:hypothetical protein
MQVEATGEAVVYAARTAFQIAGAAWSLRRKRCRGKLTFANPIAVDTLSACSAQPHQLGQVESMGWRITTRWTPNTKRNYFYRLSYAATMARSKKVNFTRSLLKIGKAANRLRKAASVVSESLDPSSSRGHSLYTGSPPAVRTKLAGTAKTPEDVAYEARIVGKLGGSVAKHFYIKLVGIKSRNSDKSSRKEAIQQLEECQELELRRERDNRFDPNAILVGAPGKTAAGHLPARLAGDVTRSLDQGYVWRCDVRRILHTPGTDNWGITGVYGEAQ